MPALAVRVQEKGKVTIPLEIRRRLRLKKGDLVTFVETEQGYLLLPAEIVVGQALEAVGKVLKEKGVTYEQLMKRGRRIRGKLLKEQYGLTDPSDE